jgi:bacillopeptidase F (M6 metalloprotease family)
LLVTIDFDKTLAGIFDPHSGDYYVYSQQADSSYKRLGGTFTLPPGSPTLKFWASYDIEPDWDCAFVEIDEVGTDTWATLPDVNGLTYNDTGLSCASGWVDQIHPFLAHYMNAGCNPTGTTGAWNAITGNSGGWQQVEIDLSAYEEKDVELYISYASDWGTQNLGVFLDDIELSGYPLEDFEVGYGVWPPIAPPTGSPESNNWNRIESFGLPEGPVIRTPNTLYLGFGFEAIDTAENRATVMERVMSYFGQ